MPRFTIIMQSYLGSYSGAASDRENKLHRALQSVLTQSFTDWELFVVADGCDQTFNLVKQYYNLPGIHCHKIDKQPLFSGIPRNHGLYHGTGDYALYLDNDDYFGVDHLLGIHNKLADYDWVWFDDFQATRDGKHFVRKTRFINQPYHHGTANICHKRELIWWDPKGGYAVDDQKLVKALKAKSGNYAKIDAGEYFICHSPKDLVDV
jgi:glycosyltransferase involved in cell wall biosynthesis